MVEEPGNAFLNRSDPDLVFARWQRIASLREGSEDGGEAKSIARCKCIGERCPSFSDP